MVIDYPINSLIYDIFEIYKKTGIYKRSESIDILLTQAKNNTFHLAYFFENNSDLVGVASIKIKQMPLFGLCGECQIIKFALNPKYQRKGISQKFLAEIEEKAKKILANNGLKLKIISIEITRKDYVLRTFEKFGMKKTKNEEGKEILLQKNI